MAKDNNDLKKTLLKTLFILLCTAVCIYINGWNKMKGHFFPNTTINGIDYSNMTPKEAEDLYRSTYSGRTLQIKEMDGVVETINFDEIGYHFATEKTFQEMVDSQPYYEWFLADTRRQVIEVKEDLAYNADRLRSAVHKLNAISGDDIKDPKDAYIKRKKKKGYVIVDAVDGNRLDENKVLELVDQSVKEYKEDSSIDLEEAGCYLKASVYADDPDLVRRFNFIDKYQKEVIKINMEGGVYETLAKDTFLDWMTFEDETVTIASEPLRAYVNALADKYDTYKKVRQFKTTNGDIVSVGGNVCDSYGFLMNRDDTCVEVREALMGGEDRTIDCIWDICGRARSKDNADFGDTYVEISLDQQHMWFYKDGNLIVDTPVVTGTANESRATPVMVTKILDKRTNHRMQGSYGTSFARYAMWLTDTGVLIHDASWRGSYGGSIFLSDGSHGCVNTPFEAVVHMYNEIDIGTPVIVYDRENRVTHTANEY